jgi:hypothetical protein
MKINTVTVANWDLIVAVCHWSHWTNIPARVKEEAYKEAWKHTDAYGEVGHIPCQGFDWSGFRDSSTESTAKSANAIRVVLAKHGITEFDAVKE